ncbi:hypothetical protein CTEN210_18256 [Chaetoceros tenuissimus]|uniref:CPBP family intramembrane metalloprotease n=1 Tax=Chaetoceros tenuissimus TaxID=426638 RepID=A0AAD3DEY9_9STRA|nr:hypothetical protein CTEN210_18256 [Chaetoceros tenuissimus]
MKQMKSVPKAFNKQQYDLLSILASFAKMNPLWSYFGLTFLTSWGVMFLFVGPSHFPSTPSEAEDLLPLMVALTLLGPSVAGLLMRYILDGNVKQVTSRLDWKFWYCAPLILIPFSVGIALLCIYFLTGSTNYIPIIFFQSSHEISSLLLIGVIYATAAGFFEEIGWSFATVYLRKTMNTFYAGLTLGIIWGLWHFQVAVIGSGTENGEFSFELFLPWLVWNILVLPAYRVLMFHVHERCNGSITAMAIMHGSLTASLPLILAPKAQGRHLATFYFTYGIELILVNMVIALIPNHVQRRKI